MCCGAYVGISAKDTMCMSVILWAAAVEVRAEISNQSSRVMVILKCANGSSV